MWERSTPCLLWEAGHKGVGTALPHRKVVSVVTGSLLTTVTHAHARTLHGSTIKRAITSLFTRPHTPTYPHSAAKFRTPALGPSGLPVTGGSHQAPGHHRGQLRSHRCWRKLQAPEEATAQHSRPDASPADSGSGEKAPLSTFPVSITPCCSNSYAPHVRQQSWQQMHISYVNNV